MYFSFRNVIRTLSSILIFSIVNILGAQSESGLNLEALTLPDSYGFKKWGLELSSVTKLNDSYYAVSEKCKLIFQFKIEADRIKVDSVIYLGNHPMWSDPVAIEGVATYGDQLIMIDEGTDAGAEAYAKLYTYDTKSSALNMIFVDGADKYLQGWTGNYGAEGIAVDETNDVLYVLNEKNRTTDNAGFATLISYDIMGTNTIINLLPKDTLSIQLADGERLSDLHYSRVSRKLHTIKVNYHERKGNSEERSKYEVCTLEFANDGDASVVDCKNFTKELITEIDYDGNTGYRTSTNIEGLVVDEDGSILIVSDNARTDKCCDENVMGESGMFKLSMQ